MRVHLDSADSLLSADRNDPRLVASSHLDLATPRTSVLRLCSTLLSTAPVSRHLTGGLETSWSVPSHRGEA